MSRKSQTLKDSEFNRTAIKDPPAETKTKSRKDTKKWCRGKVGLEHKSKWVNSFTFRYPNVPGDHSGFPGEIQICTECGKHIKLRDRADRVTGPIARRPVTW
jgi:hypothetical protein